MKQISYFLIALILLTSCDSEFKPTTFKTTPIDKAFETSITVAYDKAVGNSELSRVINTNLEKAIISTLSSYEEKTDLNTALKVFNSEFVVFKKDFPEASEPLWELNIETEITYQSEDVITIAISTYEFKGGAHGNDKIKLLNLNAKTGAILNRDNIFKNISDLNILAKSHFVNSLEAEDKDLKIEDIFFGEPFQLPENIGFSDGGLIFLYNIYEITSYNQGFTEFIIPFEDIDSYLKLN